MEIEDGILVWINGVPSVLSQSIFIAQIYEWLSMSVIIWFQGDQEVA